MFSVAVFSVMLVIIQAMPFNSGPYGRQGRSDNCAVSYVYNPALLNWDSARLACMAEGGHLAKITSLTENSDFRSLYQNVLSKHAWIGGSERDLKGFWQWDNGRNEPKQNVYFMNWARREPKWGSRYSAYCLLVVKDALWKSEDCTEEKPSVCEYEVCSGMMVDDKSNAAADSDTDRTTNLIIDNPAFDSKSSLESKSDSKLDQKPVDKVNVDLVKPVVPTSVTRLPATKTEIPAAPANVLLRKQSEATEGNSRSAVVSGSSSSGSSAATKVDSVAPASVDSAAPASVDSAAPASVDSAAPSSVSSTPASASAVPSSGSAASDSAASDSVAPSSDSAAPASVDNATPAVPTPVSTATTADSTTTANVGGDVKGDTAVQRQGPSAQDPAGAAGRPGVKQGESAADRTQVNGSAAEAATKVEKARKAHAKLLSLLLHHVAELQKTKRPCLTPPPLTNGGNWHCNKDTHPWICILDCGAGQVAGDGVVDSRSGIPEGDGVVACHDGLWSRYDFYCAMPVRPTLDDVTIVRVIGSDDVVQHFNGASPGLDLAAANLGQ